jgi:Fic family protein
MNPEDFKDSPSGFLVPTIQGCKAFVPKPLPPPRLDMNYLARPLEKATLALGQLSGVGRTLANPHLLIRPFSRVEAVASSRIEGTVTTLPELLILEVEADPSKARPDTQEVRNYTRALDHGLERIKTFPISKRLIQEMHEILLTGVGPNRGARFRPGEFKTDQNWIGARLIQNAKFVPAPPQEAMACLDDLERYIHSEGDLPLLIQLALIHYQFETIHPFPDGNGRIGRLLIPLLLCEHKALSQPLLYLSAYLERNYTKYIDLMYEVSRSGGWNEWIKFFLDGVAEAATAGVTKSTQLHDLHRNHLQRVQSARSSALLAKIVESLFAVPATTISHVMRDLDISYNSAKNNIQKLLDLKIIAKGEEGRPQWYYAPEVIMISIELKPKVATEAVQISEPQQLTLT